MAEDMDHGGETTGYGMYVLVWLSLISLTVATVAVSGISMGKLSVLAAMLIAAIKSTLVIRIFMHIKFEAVIFKVFLGVALFTLTVVFLITSSDVFIRVR